MAKFGNKFIVSFCFQTGVTTTKTLLLPIAPFKSGLWTCAYDSVTKTAQVKCTGVSTSVQVESVCLFTSIEHKGEPCESSRDGGLGQINFPPAHAWSIKAPLKTPKGAGGRSYPGRARLEVVFSPVRGPGGVVAVPAPGPSVATSTERGDRGDHRALTTALAVTAGLSLRGANDVVLYFPAIDRELFVNRDALKHAFPYFRTLLGPPFGSLDTTPEAATENLFSTADQDEGGAYPSGCSIASVETAASAGSAAGQETQRIVVKNYSYGAYRAVLVWAFSGYIRFAPIHPRALNSGPALATAASSSAADATSNLPAPVSAAAVVQLAALLQLPDLISLATDEYTSRLTVENVMSELVSDAASDEGVRELILAFASRHWQAVRQTPLALQLAKPGVVQALPNGGEVGARLYELGMRR